MHNLQILYILFLTEKRVSSIEGNTFREEATLKMLMANIYKVSSSYSEDLNIRLYFLEFWDND